MCGGRIMDFLSKKIFYIELLNIYQNLLSKTQKEILEDYFNYDLSISEIALNRDVSRSAVEDALKKGIRKMEGLEKELQILKHKEYFLKNLNLIKKENENNKQLISLVEEMERNLK